MPHLDPRERIDVRLQRAILTRTLPKETLIVGAAGTGKTYSILAFLHLLAQWNANLRILIVRQTRVSLSESVCVTYEKEILSRAGMEGIASGATRRNRTSYKYPNGSEIVLGGMDNPNRIASTSWDVIFANEAIELQEDGWEVLGSRLNRPGRPRQFGFLIGDTNPGDPAHWLKTRLSKGLTTFWNTLHQANPTLWDGTRWTPSGLDYLDRLGRLQGTRRKRFLEGVWAAGEGQWFETFGETHQSRDAEYHPAYPVHLAVDSGVHSGAVWFQVRPTRAGSAVVTVFGDYYTYNTPAYVVAQEVLAKSALLIGRPFTRDDQLTTDPAGSASTAVVGPTVLSEYARAGLLMRHWPRFPGCVLDGLRLIESFVAVAPPALTIHPRCTQLIDAFGSYKRDKRSGQYIDKPVDPQHPYEELMDALRGGLHDRYPEGRRPEPAWQRVHAGKVF